MTYRIRDWDRHYETERSRSIQAPSRCSLPNKQHGLGYGRLVTRPNGAAVYGAFVAVVLVASRQSRDVRAGWLTEDGTETGAPYSAADLAIVTRLPESAIAEALAAAVEVGWIDRVDVASPGGDRGETGGTPGGDRGQTGGTTGARADSTEQYSTEQNSTHRARACASEDELAADLLNIFNEGRTMKAGVLELAKVSDRLPGWLQLPGASREGLLDIARWQSRNRGARGVPSVRSPVDYLDQYDRLVESRTRAEAQCASSPQPGEPSAEERLAEKRRREGRA